MLNWCGYDTFDVRADQRARLLQRSIGAGIEGRHSRVACEFQVILLRLLYPIPYGSVVSITGRYILNILLNSLHPSTELLTSIGMGRTRVSDFAFAEHPAISHLVRLQLIAPQFLEQCLTSQVPYAYSHWHRLSGFTLENALRSLCMRVERMNLSFFGIRRPSVVLT